MVPVASEVADGTIVHPLYCRDIVFARSMPAFELGLRKAGRRLDDFGISCHTITVVGSTGEEIERAREKAKAQMAFCASVPASRVMLDHQRGRHRVTNA